MTYHKQVRLRANGREAHVDSGMRDLIRAIWQCDIPTVFSCQGAIDEAPWPYVVIPSFAVDEFMRIVDPPVFDWRYRTWAPLWSDDGPMMLTEVSFPARDIPHIIAALNRKTKRRVISGD
jgi:hypothetical protein